MRHPHLLAVARDSATVTLVVFSMTDLSSFKALPAMLDDLKGETIFLVATKMDLVASCSVSLAAVQELAKQNKAPLLLVSNPPFGCQPRHQAKCAPSPAFISTAFTEIARAVEQKLW